MSESNLTQAIPELTGKVAIVTGAGHGAGAAVARALAGTGASVAVNDINPDRAYRAAAELQDEGRDALGVMADVSNRFQCVHLIETTRAKWGRIDILVNCATISPSAAVLKMDEWELMRVMDVNLKGVFFMTQLTGRIMADQRRIDRNFSGLIVQLVAPEPAGTGQAAYSATQAAIPAFARACAREYGPLGIHVRALDRAADDEKTAAALMKIATDPATWNSTNP